MTAKHALTKHRLIDRRALRDWAICIVGIAVMALLTFLASRT
jgi:hypothetical protein